MTDAPDEATFTLDWLHSATKNAAPLSVDGHGRLVVAGRTWYQPVRFVGGVGGAIRGVVCRRVDPLSVND